MPTWLAIAIPSVLAVAAILMWALEYTKKAHEIQKLRLELEKLKREGERSEREEQFRGSGLYTPTPEEVDKLRVETAILMQKHSAGHIQYARSPRPGWVPVGAILVVLFATIELVREVIRLFSWLLSK